jgi:hypothetical protein
MFILTGIIGVFQLFEGPKSVGAVTVAGGSANPSAGLPERSLEATELPAWQPSASPSQTTETRTPSVVQKAVVATTQLAAPQSTTQTTQIPAQSSTQAPSTKSPVISAKAVTTTAASAAQPKVTTSAPKVTTTAPKPATTTTTAPTTAPKPSQSVLKPTATATTSKPTTQPTCYRFLIFRICR